jgi:hypothetical protein
MSTLYAADDLRRKLRTLVEGLGGVRKAAPVLRASPGHLSRVMRGQKVLDGNILAALGFRHVDRYVRLR